jgi:GPI-anchor transamidase subunit GAA1
MSAPLQPISLSNLGFDPQVTARRLRSYIFRLPLFTRCTLFIIVAFWIIGIQELWDVRQWGEIIPDGIGIFSGGSKPIHSFGEVRIRRNQRRGLMWIMGPRALLTRICVVYRLNTYPIVHAGFLHMFFNVIALTPLLERFEAEHGTLNTLAMFAGRKLTLV